MKFAVPAKIVKAAQRAASSDKTRRIINAVHFEKSALGVRAAATDSYRLAALDWAWDGDSPSEPVDIDCAAVAKLVRKTSRSIEFDTEKGTATVRDSRGAATGEALAPVVEGTFPKFDSLIPDRDSENIGFAGFANPAYLADAFAMFSDFGDKCPVQVFGCGDLRPVVFSARVQDEGEALMLVMPVRGSGNLGLYPERSDTSASKVRGENAELKKKLKEAEELRDHYAKKAAELHEQVSRDQKAEEVPPEPKAYEKPKKARNKALEVPEQFAETADLLREAGCEVSFNGTNIWATDTDGVDFEALGFARCKREGSKRCGQWFAKAS